MASKRQLIQLLMMTSAVFCTGCLVPTTSNLQSARVADKGNLRVSPYYASVNDTGGSGKIADEFGMLGGVGVGDGVEIQVRYDRVSIDEESDGYNFTSVGVKISGMDNRIAFVLPVGTYYGGGISSSETVQLHPGLIGTIPLEQVAEISGAARLLFAPNPDVDEWFVLNGGLGLSSDTSLWAIGPEVNIAWNLGPGETDPLLSYGVAFVVYSR